MLDQARRALLRELEAIHPQLEAGVPVVVLEPGCLSVFRDDLRQLLPDDPRAQRLARLATSLSQFLNGRKFMPPKRVMRLWVHAHCHQKALWGAQDDVALLRAAGCEVTAPDTGCCGMAGSFGYQAEHSAASKRIAELALLPALASAPDATVVACGFSCRVQ